MIEFDLCTTLAQLAKKTVWSAVVLRAQYVIHSCLLDIGRQTFQIPSTLSFSTGGQHRSEKAASFMVASSCREGGYPSSYAVLITEMRDTKISKVDRYIQKGNNCNANFRKSQQARLV